MARIRIRCDPIASLFGYSFGFGDPLVDRQRRHFLGISIDHHYRWLVAHQCRVDEQ
tara:strand:- start:466 stop:633 length:168 start_codon:yes stop_codon:yes gene_type:complete